MMKPEEAPAHQNLISKLSTTQKVLIVCFMAAILCGGVVRLYLASGRYAKEMKKNPALKQGDAGTKRLLTVDVDGSVHTPGVYRLSEGSTRYDAVKSAGGLRKNADTRNVNLAVELKDREKIYIPFEGETPSASGIMQSSQSESPTGSGTLHSEESTDATNGGGENDNKSSKDNPPLKPVNINTASANDLDSLPGIGPAIAKRIIDLRTRRGPFKAIEEIMLVEGIKQKTFEKIKIYIRVN